MNIEKRNVKMFNLITIIALAAILVITLSGFIQRQTMPLREVGMSNITSPLQPESSQSELSGNMAFVIGTILLMVGFGGLLLILIFPNKRSRP